jgi:hypothetical protein
VIDSLKRSQRALEDAPEDEASGREAELSAPAEHPGPSIAMARAAREQGGQANLDEATLQGEDLEYNAESGGASEDLRA